MLSRPAITAAASDVVQKSMQALSATTRSTRQYDKCSEPDGLYVEVAAERINAARLTKQSLQPQNLESFSDIDITVGRQSDIR
jgi:hypothetical protein